MFQHYIVTRFNVKSKDQNGIFSQGVSEEWMEARFKLFLDFCFPSVVNQSNRNFLWFVFFDTDTSEKYRELITKLANETDIFVPLYVDCNENITRSLKDEISSRLDCDYVITSRLDNDDCLHQEYVESVQREFKAQDYLAVNFINGVTLQFSNPALLGFRIHANNPFISLIEYAKGNIDTVFSRKHGGWGKIRSVKQVNNTPPLWLTVNHDKNIMNRYIGFGDVDIELLQGFNIVKTVHDDIVAKLKPNDKATSLSNMYRAYFYYFLKVFRNKLRSTLRLIPVK